MTWRVFEETIRRSRNRSIKGLLLRDDGEDDYWDLTKQLLKSLWTPTVNKAPSSQRVEFLLFDLRKKEKKS